MSPMKAIKTFRDLLSFFTVIPLGKTEDFVVTTAEYIYLFPVVGAFIGLLGAAYFYASHLLISYVLEFIGWFFWVPSGFLLGLIPAVMTLAFLLVLSGLQHFDGLIDLGNALGWAIWRRGVQQLTNGLFPTKEQSWRLSLRLWRF